jgi:hypothetical protein
VGNPGGPGNPHGREVASLRAALYRSVTEDDIRAIVAILVGKAKQGEAWAIKELLNRLLGKAPQFVQVASDDNRVTAADVLALVAELLEPHSDLRQRLAERLREVRDERHTDALG